MAYIITKLHYHNLHNITSIVALLLLFYSSVYHSSTRVIFKCIPSTGFVVTAPAM